MRLYAFRGTRYSQVDCDPGSLAAPPFDQIDESRQAELHARHDCQFAHLTRPTEHDESARLLDSWASERIVETDPTPLLYGYEIELAGGGSRLGLCGLIGIEPKGSDGVRPHESTVTKTIDERLNLLETTRTDLEPILMLCEKSGEFEALLEGIKAAQPALSSHTDEFGHIHRLYPVSDRETQDRFRQILASSPAWIADGHHRYRVASEFATRHEPAAGTAAATKLAVITSLASPGLRIDPIHRGLTVPVDLEAAGDAVVSRTAWEGSDGAELERAVASARQPAIGVLATGGKVEIWQLDPAAAPADLAPSAAPLAAALVHETLFGRFGLQAGASTDGTTVYRSDPHQLLAEAREGSVSVGIWLPPTSPELFEGAVAAGDRLPPKWTRFVPKLVSGLVWCSHEAEIV